MFKNIFGVIFLDKKSIEKINSYSFLNLMIVFLSMCLILPIFELLLLKSNFFTFNEYKFINIILVSIRHFSAHFFMIVFFFFIFLLLSKLFKIDIPKSVIFKNCIIVHFIDPIIFPFKFLLDGIYFNAILFCYCIYCFYFYYNYFYLFLRKDKNKILALIGLSFFILFSFLQFLFFFVSFV